MNNKMISASMMCANLPLLNQYISCFEDNSIDYLHIDVMDGTFVPNLGLGTDYIRGLRELTSIPLDIHMMAERPEEKLDWFGLQKNDTVSIHFESTPHIQRCLSIARQHGCRVFLAINPGTSIYAIEELLEYIDGINVLTVNPGFAGQKIVHSCIEKVKKITAYLHESGFDQIIVEVDGNVSFTNARLLSDNGANMFVAGTSSLFKGHIEDMAGNIARLRESIE